MLQGIEGLQLHGHLTTDAIRGCVYCKELHYSASCERVQNLVQRKEILMKERRCLKCLALQVILLVRAKMRRFAAIVNNAAIISQFARRFHLVTAAKGRETNLKGILPTRLQRTLLETKEQFFSRQRRVLLLMRTTRNRPTCVYCLTMEASEVT